MKATATLTLDVDITQAKEMGLEIDDPKEYATEEFLEWVYEMMKHNDLAKCIKVKVKK